jgi:hypothetical protein
MHFINFRISLVLRSHRQRINSKKKEKKIRSRTKYYSGKYYMLHWNNRKFKRLHSTVSLTLITYEIVRFINFWNLINENLDNEYTSLQYKNGSVIFGFDDEQFFFAALSSLEGLKSKIHFEQEFENSPNIHEDNGAHSKNLSNYYSFISFSFCRILTLVGLLFRR